MSILLSLVGSNVPTAPSGSLMSKITIDNCSASGHQGPTDAQITAAAVTNVTASGYQGYQVFTAPNTGTYQFELAGGMGGVNTGNPHSTAGDRTRMRARRTSYSAEVPQGVAVCDRIERQRRHKLRGPVGEWKE